MYPEGKYVIVDPLGYVVAVRDIVTSWAAKTYKVVNGKLIPIN